MTFLRSLLFNLAFYGLTTILAFLLLPLIVTPRSAQAAGRFWGWLTHKLLFIAGLSHQNDGDSLRSSQVIYAVKHQSAWETLILYWQLGAPVVVLKKELMMIPILGWFFAQAGCIALDRGAGMAALRQLRAQADIARRSGRSILIFPQGTRVAPGTSRPYQIGVFALYEQTGLAVLPVALNSGQFWGRRGFTKKPGRICVSYLPVIATGLKRKEFMKNLEIAIETRNAELEAAPLHPHIKRTARIGR